MGKNDFLIPTERLKSCHNKHMSLSDTFWFILMKHSGIDIDILNHSEAHEATEKMMEYLDHPLMICYYKSIIEFEKT